MVMGEIAAEADRIEGGLQNRSRRILMTIEEIRLTTLASAAG
jgi:hypothetical protein